MESATLDRPRFTMSKKKHLPGNPMPSAPSGGSVRTSGDKETQPVQIDRELVAMASYIAHFKSRQTGRRVVMREVLEPMFRKALIADYYEARSAEQAAVEAELKEIRKRMGTE